MEELVEIYKKNQGTVQVIQVDLSSNFITDTCVVFKSWTSLHLLKEFYFDISYNNIE